LKQGGVLIIQHARIMKQRTRRTLTWLRDEQGVEFISLQIDPSWGVEQITKDNVMGIVLPHKVKGEGLFLSVMRRRMEAKAEWSIEIQFYCAIEKDY